MSANDIQALAGCGKRPAGDEFLGTDVVISGLVGGLSS
jgi:hypothetical protein